MDRRTTLSSKLTQVHVRWNYRPFSRCSFMMQRNPACSNDVIHDNVPDKFNWIFTVNASEVANRFKIDIVAEIEYCDT